VIVATRRRRMRDVCHGGHRRNLRQLPGRGNSRGASAPAPNPTSSRPGSIADVLRLVRVHITQARVVHPPISTTLRARVALRNELSPAEAHHRPPATPSAPTPRSRSERLESRQTGARTGRGPGVWTCGRSALALRDRSGRDPTGDSGASSSSRAGVSCVRAETPASVDGAASRFGAASRRPLLRFVHLSSEQTPKPVRKTAPLPRSRSLTRCACTSFEGGAGSMSPPHLLPRNR
jgi:hypothetical protein